MEEFFNQYGGTLGAIGVLLGIIGSLFGYWGVSLARRSEADAKKAKSLEQQRLKTIQERLHGDIVNKAILIGNVVARIKNNIEYNMGVPALLKPQIDNIEIEAKNIESAANNVIDWMK